MDTVAYRWMAFSEGQQQHASVHEVSLPELEVAQTLEEALVANATPLGVSEENIVAGALAIGLKNHVHVVLGAKEVTENEKPVVKFEDKLHRDIVGLELDPDPEVDRRYLKNVNRKFWSAILVSSSLCESESEEQALEMLRNDISKKSRITKLGGTALSSVSGIFYAATLVNPKFAVPAILTSLPKMAGVAARWRAGRMRRPLEDLHFARSDEFEKRLARKVSRKASSIAKEYPVISFGDPVENVKVKKGRL